MRLFPSVAHDPFCHKFLAPKMAWLFGRPKVPSEERLRVASPEEVVMPAEAFVEETAETAKCSAGDRVLRDRAVHLDTFGGNNEPGEIR